MKLPIQIGMYEKIEILHKNYDICRTSNRTKKGFESREIEVRVYI